MLGTITDEQISVADKASVLNELTQELYEQANRQILPAKGWVLLRVLPKEHIRNGIILPSNHQQKPLYEGIVLATWQPYVEEISVTDPVAHKTITKVVQHSSELHPGDHVLFEHWAGVPFETDQKAHADYRLVKEQWTQTTGGIISVIDYADGDTRPHAQLTDLIYVALADGDGKNPVEAERLAGLISAQIQHKFLLVDKEQRSITLTGV